MIATRTLWQRAFNRIRNTPIRKRRVKRVNRPVRQIESAETLEERLLLAGVNSDDFNIDTTQQTSPDPQWTFTDPNGDATLSVDGTSVRIFDSGRGQSQHRRERE